MIRIYLDVDADHFTSSEMVIHFVEMKMIEDLNLVSLDMTKPVWQYFYTVAPLVVVGTKEGNAYDMAPKHMAMPLGRDNYFGFICTPAHSTWHNVLHTGYFTVSFPRPDQVTLASLAASPRCGENNTQKPIVDGLPMITAPGMDAPFLKDSYLALECTLDRIVEGFGDFGLIAGKISAAYLDPESMRVSEGDDGDMIRENPLMAYLPYGRFAQIKETFVFPMPKGFENGSK